MTARRRRSGLHADVTALNGSLLRWYGVAGRAISPRETRDPWRLLVFEVMSHQTQLARAIEALGPFVERFPDPGSLAAASPADVLRAWAGLGYNRRALALNRLARTIVSTHGGTIPRSVAELQRLPGIGYATAAAVCVYAYEMPVAFIETNVRTAFIHFFFQECSRVSDAELMPLVELTLDRESPRDWYYALMDYGTWLKQTQANPARRSKHHVVQSPFAGSRRQARALMLRLLLKASPTALTLGQLLESDNALAARGAEEVDTILSALVEEGFLVKEGGRYRVA